MDSQAETVVIKPGDVKVITLTNTPKGGLIIKKMDAITKAPLSDVLFKVTTEAGVPMGIFNGEYHIDSAPCQANSAMPAYGERYR